MDISHYYGQSFLTSSSSSNASFRSSSGASAGGTSIAPSSQNFAASTQASTTTSETASASGGLFEQLIDTVNPLQHIPGVSSVYRESTGDTINPLSSMAGGFLFGGPVGLAAGAASSFLEMLTGKSLLGHAQAFLSGEHTPQPDTNPTAVAQAQTHIGASAQPTGRPEGLSIKQYKEFADATSANHSGIGADSRNVAWADNIWTQQSLMQATGQYESAQTLGGSEKNRSQRLI